MYTCRNGIGLVQTLLLHCLRYWECHWQWTFLLRSSLFLGNLAGNILQARLFIQKDQSDVMIPKFFFFFVVGFSSIGVDAGGYENEGISNLREKLSAFLQCETTLKAGFAVQIATVSSLMKTLHLDFSVVVQGKTTMLPGCGDQSLSASANLVTKWFSLLSDEQRVFSNKFLQTSVVR